jgi:putative salt-induced outer membrane protein
MKIILIAFVALLSASVVAQNKFSHESGLTLIETAGNTETETYDLSTKNVYDTTVRKYILSGHYTLSSVEDNNDATDNTTARNWDIKLGMEQSLSEKLFAIFSIQYEGNEFANLNQRRNIDLGLKYILTKTDKMNQSAAFGYRTSEEQRITRDEDGDDQFTFSKGFLKYEIDHKVTKTMSYAFWTEYIPNFTESDDYQINFEPSLSVVMTDMFSLKVAYKGMYDNERNPGVEERLDTITTTSLIAKF